MLNTLAFVGTCACLVGGIVSVGIMNDFAMGSFWVGLAIVNQLTEINSR